MSTKPIRGAEVTRWIRRFLAVILLWNLGTGIYDFAMGRIFGLISFACVAALVVTMTWQTRVIHRIERANRPRPDYSLIAAMEREVYGETFGHEGAPNPVRMVAGQTRMCARCMAPYARIDGHCAACYGKRRRAGRWDFDDDRRAMRELGEHRRAALSAMRPGRVRYTVPWAMWADLDGSLWLHPDYGSTSQPQGTSSMRVEVRDDGYHVWPPRGEDYKPQAEAGYVGSPSRQFIPVAVLEDVTR
jgi:hypothetical protein